MAIQQFETSYLQIVRRLVALVLLAALLTGCSKENDVPGPEPTGETQHTFLLYMPGLSLRSFYLANIRRIEQYVVSGMPANGRILVCYQPESYDKATLLELRYDAQTQQCVTETLKIYEHFQAESPASLQELFLDLSQFAPARTYGLTIGSHGSAWIPETLPLSLERNGQDAAGPSGLVTRAEYNTEEGVFTRAFGDSGHRMEITTLADLVEQLPYRFDYLIFDACFMANIEQLYDLRNSFDYVVGSPCEILGAGFPYDRALPHIFASGGPDLAGVCYEFWYFYMYDWDTEPNNDQSGCISLAVMSELDALADCAAALQAGPLRDCQPGELQYYEGMSSHLFYDFDQYMRAICADDVLYQRFEQQLNRAFPVDCRLHTPEFYSIYSYRRHPVDTYSGVSTSAPSARYQEYYQNTNWYRRIHGLQ